MRPARLGTSCAAIALATTVPAVPAHAGLNPFIGEVMPVGFTFCPRGWANADGQLLPINSNQALYSLYGTTYGGDGRTTFALPDLRGRVPIHTGTGPGLTSRPLGSRSGQENVTLTLNELPSHNHSASLRGEGQTTADSANPAGNTLARGATIYSDTSPPDAADALHSGSVVIGNNGGNLGHNNMQPYLTIRWCVALQGTFPSRS